MVPVQMEIVVILLNIVRQGVVMVPVILTHAMELIVLITVVVIMHIIMVPVRMEAVVIPPNIVAMGVVMALVIQILVRE